MSGRRQELSSEVIEYKQHISDEALIELNKEVKCVSGKCLKNAFKLLRKYKSAKMVLQYED